MSRLSIAALRLIVVFAFAIECNETNAAVLLDQSPSVAGGNMTGPWMNVSNNQNFAESLSLVSEGAWIWAVDVYTLDEFASVGRNVRIRIWDDDGGTPGNLLHNFGERLSVVDSDGIGDFSHPSYEVVRAHADFVSNGPVFLPAGSYWVGMMGSTSSDLGLIGIEEATHPAMDGYIAQFHSNTFHTVYAGIGDAAMRIHGQLVPEPTTYTLALAALCFAVKTRRTR